VIAAQILKQALSQGVSLFVENSKLGFKVEKGKSFSAELKQTIGAHKPQIIELLETYGGENYTPAAVIGVASREEPLLLSFSQQRLWVINQLEGSSAHYNMPIAMKVDGAFNPTVAEQALQRIVARHEVLRTVYHSTAQGPYQVIREVVKCPMNVVDLSALAGEEQAFEVSRLSGEDALKPFDLTTDVMLRASWLVLNERSGVLLFNMHHIASDGWSMAVLIREFVTAYQALNKGLPDQLAPLAIQYADYAVWNAEHMSGDVLQEHLDFWSEQLEDAPIVHGVPMDFERPSQMAHQGAIESGMLSAQLSEKLTTLASEQKVTRFMLMHAAFSLLLQRYSNNNDIVIGTPIANRLQQELEPLIGFFVNALVLRSSSEGQTTFVDYLQHIKQVNLDAQAHQATPFEQLVEHLNVPRSGQHTPLFQIMFSMDTNEQSTLELDGLSFTPVDNGQMQAKFDLLFEAVVAPQGVYLNWTYDKALFKPETILQMNRHLTTLLSAILDNPTISLQQLPMLTEAETHFLLHTVNDTKKDYPTDRLMHELFIDQAKITPDAVALTDSEGSLTYRELYQLVHVSAQRIGELALEPEEVIAVRLRKGRKQAVSTLAIMMAGAAYLPLDVSWPGMRCSGILTQANSRYLITDQDLNEIEKVGLSALSFDQLVDASVTLPDFAFDFESAINSYTSKAKTDDLAYVIFTSGSTGKPKGVAIEHKTVVNTLLDINARYGVTAKDKVLAVSALCFDMSVYDLFGLLAAGGEVVFPEHQCGNDPKHWLDMVERHEITLWNTVPVSAGLLVEQIEINKGSSFNGMRTVMMGGDCIAPSLPKKLWKHYPQAKLYSIGGATEGSICSIDYPILEDTSHLKSVPYGKPLANQAFYVLDAQLRLLPVGTVGELYIGGEGVARGYVGDAELTAKHFFYHQEFGTRLYRCGDMGRHFADGNIEFCGRIDHQVKIRGFRVELGEIELQLNNIDAIEANLVVARQSLTGDKQLVAYVIPKEALKEDQSTLISSLKTELGRTLPSYMVPTAFVLIERWPLTGNGKLDKKALPEPDYSSQQVEYVAPVGETEQQLVKIWSELLNVPPPELSTKANFFDMGGHSLLAIRLSNMIEAKFAVDIAIYQLFEVAQLDNLAALIEEMLLTGGGQKASAIVAVNSEEALSEDDIEEFEF
jgi:amino acid adenylation domain-containing protein